MKRVILSASLAFFYVSNVTASSILPDAENSLNFHRLMAEKHDFLPSHPTPQLTYENNEGNTYSGDSSEDDSGEDFEKE